MIGVIETKEKVKREFGGLEWIGVPVTLGAGTADAAAGSTADIAGQWRVSDFKVQGKKKITGTG